jgi:hypothetical protein
VKSYWTDDDAYTGTPAEDTNTDVEYCFDCFDFGFHAAGSHA